MGVGEITLDSTPDKRTKRFRTRSRTGCVTCRQRHVRCDEKFPICANCTSSSKSCSWEHTNIPLRDRRATKYPGEQAPWATQGFLTSRSPSESISPEVNPSWPKKVNPSSSFKLTLGEPLDPFDTMNIKMPFKSKELFHYFYHSASSFGNIPGTQKFVTTNMHDPYVFRNTLLIAGLHYAWNVGDLSSFDSTFLFHKVQSIRTINTWIENRTSSSLTLCLRHIATLCVVECCLGNFVTAETHLNGLMLLLDTKEASEMIRCTPEEDLEHEFAERYLIMAFNLVHSLKSRFDDFVLSTPNLTSSSRHMDPKEVANLIHQWHIHEATGISARLRAMNMFPSFFGPISAEVRIQQIEVQPMLCCMREITDTFNLRYSELYHGTKSALPYHLWASSGPSKLLFAVIDAHISSITEHPSASPVSSQDLRSSWSGICIAVGLYLTSVLGVWNQGYPAENRLLHHILHVLRQDLEDNFANVMKNGTAAQDLWFWKAFLGALSLAHVDSLADFGVGYTRLLDLVPVFNHYIRTWAETVGISTWRYARERLKNIVFPTHCQREVLAKVVWNRALAASKASRSDNN